MVQTVEHDELHLLVLDDVLHDQVVGLVYWVWREGGLVLGLLDVHGLDIDLRFANQV